MDEDDGPELIILSSWSSEKAEEDKVTTKDNDTELTKPVPPAEPMKAKTADDSDSDVLIIDSSDAEEEEESSSEESESGTGSDREREQGKEDGTVQRTATTNSVQEDETNPVRTEQQDDKSPSVQEQEASGDEVTVLQCNSINVNSETETTKAETAAKDLPMDTSENDTVSETCRNSDAQKNGTSALPEDTNATSVVSDIEVMDSESVDKELDQLMDLAVGADGAVETDAEMVESEHPIQNSTCDQVNENDQEMSESSSEVQTVTNGETVVNARTECVILEAQRKGKPVEVITLGDSDDEKDNDGLCILYEKVTPSFVVVYEKLSPPENNMAASSRPAQPPRKRTPLHLKRYGVFIANLPYRVQMGHIESFFASNFVNVRSISMFSDRSGRATGKAVLEVLGIDSYRRALNMHGGRFMGRRLHIKRRIYKKKDEPEEKKKFDIKYIKPEFKCKKEL